MIDLEGNVSELVRQAAVFASIARPPPHQCLQRAFHACSADLGPAVAAAALEGAAGPGLENTEQAADAAVGFDFSPFPHGQRALPRPGGELMHAVLVGRTEAEGQDRVGGRGREGRFVGAYEAAEDGRFGAG